MSKLKMGAAWAILVVGTTTTILQHRTNAKLGLEIETLRQKASEIERLRAENQRLAAMQANAEELERLRSEHLELLQLRGQVGVLRSELAAAQASQSQRAPIGRAVVRAVRGTVEFSGASGSWNELRIGKVLNSASQVKTGVDSQVDLFLGDNGPTVRVLPDTTLALERLDSDRTGEDVVIETRLDLKAGTIQGNVKLLSSSSVYQIKTPSTVCSTKGGEYQISADGTLHVLKRTVTVTYRDRDGTLHTRDVNAGETFVLPASAVPDSKP